MLRQKIFCTFLWFTLPILVFISLAAFFVSHIIRDHDKIYTLEQFSSVMSTIVNEEGMDALNSLRFHDNGFRITIIDITGEVIFDTERNPSLLENHISREEVIAAIETGKGSSQRYSSTLEQQTYYHAVKLQNGDILRISFITETILTYTLRMAAYFIVLLIFIVLASSFIARRLAKYLMEPFDQIDLNKPLSFNTYEELIPFLSRITEQQTKIDEQIAELNRKNNELQVIIKSMSDGLVLLNAQGTILTINKIARKIFGVTKENCINQNYLSIDHSQYMQDLMTNQSQQSKQTMQITKDGRDYEIRFNRIEDNQKCLGFAMMILDVTDKVRSEQMRQEFTANVSHELKTPLQSIIGYSELMANGLVRTDDIKPFAERIHKQSTRLQNLIEDIIFLSSLDEGSAALTEPVSLLQITTEVFDNLQEKAKENHITLNIEGKDIMFVAVNRYIYELIYNLVDNAIRYNKPYGSVKVSLKSSANKYQLEVKDTGIGVSPAEQYRIFERFYRVDKSHSRKTGGTGLGLSIVKRVVMFHHGKIKVQSVLGEGTSITVTFNKEKLEQVVVENQLKQQQQADDIRKSAVVSTEHAASSESSKESSQSLELNPNLNEQAATNEHNDLASDQGLSQESPEQPDNQLNSIGMALQLSADQNNQQQSQNTAGQDQSLANNSNVAQDKGFVEELDFSDGKDHHNDDNEQEQPVENSYTIDESTIIRRPAPITDFSYVFDRSDDQEGLAANAASAQGLNSNQTKDLSQPVDVPNDLAAPAQTPAVPTTFSEELNGVSSALSSTPALNSLLSHNASEVLEDEHAAASSTAATKDKSTRAKRNSKLNNKSQSSATATKPAKTKTSSSKTKGSKVTNGKSKGSEKGIRTVKQL